MLPSSKMLLISQINFVNYIRLPEKYKCSNNNDLIAYIQNIMFSKYLSFNLSSNYIDIIISYISVHSIE